MTPTTAVTVSQTLLVLHGTPPSLNAQGRVHPLKQHRLKAGLQHDLEVLLMAQRLPPLRFAAATAVLRFPVRRRRDEGNFRWLLEKALGDALTARWLPDDTPEHYTFAGVTFAPETGPPQTMISLHWSSRRSGAAA